MLEVHDLNQSIVMSVLKKGLKAGPFYFFLLERFPYDLTKMLAYAN